jgi:hypothetical protein
LRTHDGDCGTAPGYNQLTKLTGSDTQVWSSPGDVDPPKRRPYAEWTRKIGGTTVTRRLTPRELAEY